MRWNARSAAWRSWHGDGHSPDHRHAAAFGGCGDRLDQGELPDAHRLRGVVAGGLADDSGQRRRGEAAGPRRYAVYADGRGEAEAVAGVYVSDQEIDKLVAFWTQERFLQLQRPCSTICWRRRGWRRTICPDGRPAVREGEVFGDGAYAGFDVYVAAAIARGVSAGGAADGYAGAEGGHRGVGGGRKLPEVLAPDDEEDDEGEGFD